MSVEDLIVEGKKTLHKDQVILILSTLLEMNYFDIYLNLDLIVSDEIVDKYRNCILSMRENKPIQYLFGYTNFYGYNFKVNSNVLIPRFETEMLVDRAKEYIKRYFDDINIVDVGTGSGIIAIVLKKFFPECCVDAVDISPLALDVAKENAKLLNADVNFILGDMLKPLNKKYDVIISNPPYLISDDEIDNLVLNNEPHVALFGGEDGLKYYREILYNCKRILNDRNMIAFETGINQKEIICNYAKEVYPDAKIECFKDFNGLDRYIFIFNNCE